jgi:hypothetical protein
MAAQAALHVHQGQRHYFPNAKPDSCTVVADTAPHERRDTNIMELESDVKFMQVCVIEEIKQLVLDLWYERLPLSQAIDLHSSQRHPVCHSRAIVTTRLLRVLEKGL